MQAPRMCAGEDIHHPRPVFQWLGSAVIVALMGLSLWAVATVQLASRPEGDSVRYWYLFAFVLLELWVCVGLVFLASHFRQGRWGAGLIALLIWLAAVGLSAVQEKRFHTLFDSQIDAGVAEQLAERANAEKRTLEREAALAALTKPSRSAEAIQAELTGYETRSDAEKYPTRITALRAELKATQSHADLSAELEADRKILADTAALATDRRDARKVGQGFTLFGIHVAPDASLWILIATMLAIKSLGPWLLMSHAAKPVQLIASTGLAAEAEPEALPGQTLEDPNWIEVERTDRQGRVRLVKVPRPTPA